MPSSVAPGVPGGRCGPVPARSLASRALRRCGRAKPKSDPAASRRRPEERTPERAPRSRGAGLGAGRGAGASRGGRGRGPGFPGEGRALQEAAAGREQRTRAERGRTPSRRGAQRGRGECAGGTGTRRFEPAPRSRGSWSLQRDRLPPLGTPLRVGTGRAEPRGHPRARGARGGVGAEGRAISRDPARAPRLPPCAPQGAPTPRGPPDLCTEPQVPGPPPGATICRRWRPGPGKGCPLPSARTGRPHPRRDQVQQVWPRKSQRLHGRPGPAAARGLPGLLGARRRQWAGGCRGAPSLRAAQAGAPGAGGSRLGVRHL